MTKKEKKKQHEKLSAEERAARQAWHSMLNSWARADYKVQQLVISGKFNNKNLVDSIGAAKETIREANKLKQEWEKTVDALHDFFCDIAGSARAVN